MELNHLGLFEGIGGFSLAAQWMGWETKAWCEINPFCQTVLKHHFPKAECFEDIKLANFEKFKGKIDIITGGFPCQPYSSAGKRKGKEDERHLWPHMLKAIRAVQPRWVVGENVLGLVNWNGGLVFHEVQTDLEAAGYEVFPYVLPAASVNAPHRRDRVWFIAHSNSCRNNRAERSKGRIWEQQDKGQSRGRRAMQTNGLGNEWDVTDPMRNGIDKGGEGGQSKQLDEDGIKRRATMHTNGTSKQREHIGQTREGKFNGPDSRDGFNNFKNFPTQPPICGGDDGLPTELDGITFSKWRTESIKAFGNAIVPQVVLQIFKAIEQYEAKKLSRIGHQ
jgi:DNA (cytosine-5)-methyltransferase 1